MRARLAFGVAVLVAAGLAAADRAPEPRPPSAAAGYAPLQQDWNAPYDSRYHFVRVQYDLGGRSRGFGGFGRGRGEPAWAHDYPRADRNFLQILSEITYIDANPELSNVVTFNDPELFNHPIAYIVEVGAWNPTDEEVERLGEYLRKGGFLIVDDFRDGYSLQNLEFHLSRALPGMEMIMLDETHEIFDSFFRVDPVAVIPPYGGGIPIYYGVFEDNDPEKRVQVIINFENDLAEYWEYSERGFYPIDLSNEAYKLGVNYIVYALTH